MFYYTALLHITYHPLQIIYILVMCARSIAGIDKVQKFINFNLPRWSTLYISVYRPFGGLNDCHWLVWLILRMDLFHLIYQYILCIFKKSKNVKYHRHFSFLYTNFVMKEKVKVTFYASYWQNDQYQRGFHWTRVPHPDINQPLNRTTSINKPIKDHPSITL